MIKFLLRTLVFLLSAAVGIAVTSWIFDGFDLDGFDVVWSEPLGFILAVVIFAAVQAIISPFILRVANRNAPALVGATGLISTIVALLVATLVTDGLVVDTVLGWILGSVVVWLVTMLATLLLPMLLIKEGVEKAREND
ncbi:phage holin family protein [Cellulomonas sp. PhB143]|uniref:phage holin family protein n=1 Tax=Cellulomonas sp. PhB143 TaxID=2485186 RepID=UPI000F4A4637|nr:phage holin family protein [Cellulomonas sp. PhB143]ROS76561.1 superfamily IV 4 TMS phage holin [Cellulomonas sp. PhB143]